MFFVLLASLLLGIDPPAGLPVEKLVPRAKPAKSFTEVRSGSRAAEAASPRSPAIDAGDSEAARVADGGTDAGLPRVTSFDGTTLFDGGLTDVIEVAVGASADLKLPRHVIDVVCDDSSVARLEVLAEAFRFTGVSVGVTHCGFWYIPSPVAARYVEVRVGEAAEAPPPPPPADEPPGLRLLR